MVGTVIKSKIGELEEEVKAGSLRSTKKDLNCVVQGVSVNNMFLASFHDECENNMS